jgi:RIP metalloprotease RseP
MTDTQAPPRPELPQIPERHAASTGGGGVSHAGLRLAALLGALALVGWWRPWVLVVITALVAMIALHELGHYLTAKRAGMKVTEFFLFFGPKVWSIQRGETEYGIKCIPLGAYVKIIGMTNLEEVPPEDEGRTYRQKTFGQRVSVAVAGSTMHFLLALVLIVAALTLVGQPGGTLNGKEQAENWRIGSLVDGAGAQVAGLEPGDRIIEIDGSSVGTFDDLRTITQPLKGETVSVTYERDGQERTVDVTLDPFYSWYVDRVVPGSALQEAGIQVGDQILEIDGVSTTSSADLDERLQSLDGETVPLLIERGSDRATVEVELESLILAGREGYIGIGRDIPEVEKKGLIEGIAATPGEFASLVRLSASGMMQLFSFSGISDYADQVGSAQADRDAIRAEREAQAPPTSDESSSRLDQSAGRGAPSENRPTSIVGLVQVGSYVGEVDPGALVSLFVLINIFIGMFNLVPLLPLDGGHVMIAVYEKIQEKRLHRKRYFTDVARLMPLTYGVVLVLGILFVSSVYLDIANPLVS